MEVAYNSWGIEFSYHHWFKGMKETSLNVPLKCLPDLIIETWVQNFI